MATEQAQRKTVPRSDDEVTFLLSMTDPTNLDGVSKAYSAASKSGVPSNLIVANYLDFLFLHQKWDDINNTFEQARKSGKSSVHLWTTAIRSACAAGDFNKARQLLDQMKAEGKVAPTARVYASLIAEAAKKENALAAAQSLLDEMKSQGIKPDGLVYHALIVVNIKQNKKEAVAQIMKEMEDQGIEVNPLTHALLQKLELHSQLPKLKKKKRTPQQIKDNKTVTGAKLLKGPELIKSVNALKQKFLSKEIERQQSAPQKPDDYPTRADLPEGLDVETQNKLMELLRPAQEEARDRALVEQRQPPPPIHPIPSQEVADQSFNPTFYWLLNNHLRLMAEEPDFFELSPKSREAVQAYLTSIGPKQKKKQH